jgi:hypothetical protein
MRRSPTAAGASSDGRRRMPSRRNSVTDTSTEGSLRRRNTAAQPFDCCSLRVGSLALELRPKLFRDLAQLLGGQPRPLSMQASGATLYPLVGVHCNLSILYGYTVCIRREPRCKSSRQSVLVSTARSPSRPINGGHSMPIRLVRPDATGQWCLRYDLRRVVQSVTSGRQLSPGVAFMLNLFLRPWSPPLLIGGRRKQPPDGQAAVRIGSRPDFDLSDFDEPTPTMPGGYWHGHDERDDALKVS